MKIPFKITKAQATALHKKNYKYLTDEINGQHGDLMVEADCCKSDTRELQVTFAEVLETMKSWTKDVKVAFRDYLKDKAKIEKSFQRGIKK